MFFIHFIYLRWSVNNRYCIIKLLCVCVCSQWSVFLYSWWKWIYTNANLFYVQVLLLDTSKAHYGNCLRIYTATSIQKSICTHTCKVTPNVFCPTWIWCSPQPILINRFQLLQYCIKKKKFFAISFMIKRVKKSLFTKKNNNTEHFF